MDAHKNPDREVGALASTSMRETGQRPETVSTEDREKALKPKEHAKGSIIGMPSYAAISAEQAQEAKKAFVAECIARGTLFPTAESEALYADQERFRQVCSEYLVFCFNNNISLSLTNLALWLGVHKETLSRILRNGEDIDPRYDTLRSMVNIIDYSMEQELVSYEGNPTGRIFMSKARLGWQEAAQQVDINFGIQQPTPHRPETLPEAINLIDITPDIE